MSSSTSPVRSYHQRDRSAEGASQGRQRKTSLGQRPPSSVSGGGAASSSRYQSSHLASTSSSTATRRHSLFGIDDRVVLDIGSRVTKVGFSGEARPRDIFWSLNGVPPALSQEGLLWTMDLCRCKNEEERKRVKRQLKSRLTAHLRAVFYQRLLVDPKQRKVIIVESALMPTIVKRVICEVLFENLQVPSISFVPAHLLSTLAIGRMSSIVLDLGYQEATLLPIQHGRPLALPYLLTSPRSGKRLARRLRALLLHFATFIPPPTLGSLSTSSAFKGKVSSDMLTPDFLDEIKAKALLVGDSLGGKEEGEGSIEVESGAASEWTAGQAFTEKDEAADDVQMRLLESRYKQRARTKDLIVSLPPLPREPIGPVSKPATFGAPPLPVASGRGSLLIPGWVRERAAEVLFESGDEDEMSLTDMLLTTLIKLPVDLRSTLASNIYVVGGTAMLPGLAHRLRVEVVRRLVEARPSEEERLSTRLVALSLPRVGPAAPPSRATAKDARPIDTIEEGEEGHSLHHATSADSFVTSRDANEKREAAPPSLVTLESKAMMAKRKRREDFRFAPISSLASSIAILNDHAPRIAADGRPVGGVAPSFAVNLSSWIGASLMGSLRIETADSKSREAWDEEEEERERVRAKTTKKEVVERPSMGSGRGSFLGTVGGLDLGTYGPLSAGARGPFGGSNPRSPPLS